VLVAVAADRVHRFLAKDQLVAFDLHSMWFDHGVIGVEKASEVVMQKPLTQLNLAELAELQLAIPPWGFWDDIKNCRNAAKLKEARFRRQVRPGERFEVEIIGIPERRGPSTEARTHYVESAESEAARAAVREFNRLTAPVPSGRPDKRERRDLLKFQKGRGPSS
jgi:hypothetical protein